MFKIFKVLILLLQYSTLSAIPLYQSSVTKVLPQKSTETNELDYKYFIIKNGNRTWWDKFIMNSKLVRPLWIDAIGDGEQGIRGKYIPVQPKNPLTNLWVKKHKIIGQDEQLGIEEKELDEPDAEELKINETEDKWTHKEAFIEQHSKLEIALNDHLRPERGIERSATFEYDNEELDHFPVQKQMTWKSEANDNISMDKTANSVPTDGDGPLKGKRVSMTGKSAVFVEEEVGEMITEQKQMNWQTEEEIKFFPDTHEPIEDDRKEMDQEVLAQATPALPLGHKSTTSATDDPETFNEESEFEKESQLDKTTQTSLSDKKTPNTVINEMFVEETMEESTPEQEKLLKTSTVSSLVPASVDSTPSDVTENPFFASTGTDKILPLKSEPPLEADVLENIHQQPEKDQFTTVILNPESDRTTKNVEETTPEQDNIQQTTPASSSRPAVIEVTSETTFFASTETDKIITITSEPQENLPENIHEQPEKGQFTTTIVIPGSVTKNFEEDTVEVPNPEPDNIPPTIPVSSTRPASVETTPLDGLETAFFGSSGSDQILPLTSKAPAKEDVPENIGDQTEITWLPDRDQFTTKIFNPDGERTTKKFEEQDKVLQTTTVTSSRPVSVETTPPDILGTAFMTPTGTDKTVTVTSAAPVKEDVQENIGEQPEKGQLTTIISSPESDKTTKPIEESTPEQDRVLRTSTVSSFVSASVESTPPVVPENVFIASTGTDKTTTVTSNRPVEEKVQENIGEHSEKDQLTTITVTPESDRSTKSFEETVEESNTNQDNFSQTTPVPSSASLLFHEIAFIFSLMSWTVIIFKVC